MKKILPKVRKIINMSIKQAKIHNDYEVKIEYIIMSLINDYNNSAIKIINSLGVNIDKLYHKIEKEMVKNKLEKKFHFNTPLF